MPRPKAPNRLKQVLSGTLIVNAEPALPNVDDIIIPPLGRPPKYEKWMCDKIVEVAARRGHVAQMCLAIGLRSKTTFYQWLDKYSDFNEAYQLCKTYAEAIIDQTFTDGALGKIQYFNYSALERLARAKCGDEYKETSASTVNNNFNGVTNFNLLTIEQINERIADSERKLGLRALPEGIEPDGSGESTA